MIYLKVTFKRQRFTDNETLTIFEGNIKEDKKLCEVSGYKVRYFKLEEIK